MPMAPSLLGYDAICDLVVPHIKPFPSNVEALNGFEHCIRACKILI